MWKLAAPSDFVSLGTDKREYQVLFMKTFEDRLLVVMTSGEFLFGTPESLPTVTVVAKGHPFRNKEITHA